MELRQLVYAEAVVRHRHFTRAAEELHVAQSALSHQIRRLEAELGAELFERTSRRVVPTEAGEALAKRARRVLGELEGVRGDIDELRGLVGCPRFAVRGETIITATLGPEEQERLTGLPHGALRAAQGAGDLAAHLTELAHHFAQLPPQGFA